MSSVPVMGLLIMAEIAWSAGNRGRSIVYMAGAAFIAFSEQFL